ncbi:MAG: hypothetical protein NDJ24_10645 [Alphaproteobacteria bacterium]|nr:hypothetical protein [Alphaproteobacteria bacterium]
MSKKFGFLKSGLMGSSTLPMGTGGAVFNLFPVAGHHHEHAADGSCCGHDHSHHHHEHDQSCSHDHVHDENCGHDHK